MMQFSRLKPFRPILLGVLLFLVANGGITLMAGKSPELHEKLGAKVDNLLPRKLEQLEAVCQEPIDVLALGTSQTHNGFATGAFEEAVPVPVNSFNMGLPGTRYDVMQSYLDYHIRRCGKPQIILLEITDALVEDETTYFYLPALHYKTLIQQQPDLAKALLKNPLTPLTVKKEVLLSFSSVFYQYRPLFTPNSLMKKVAKTGNHVASKLLEPVMASSPDESVAETDAFRPPQTPEEAMELLPPSWIQKGWVPKYPFPQMKTQQGIAENAQNAYDYYLKPLNTVDFRKLEAFLAYTQTQDIPVVLVRWPNHPAYLEHFKTSPVYDAYHQELDRVLRHYPVGYLQLDNEPPASNTAMYADTRHLSPKGAVHFSAIIAWHLMADPKLGRIFSVNPSQN